jgi:hypothetical protein
MTRALREVPEGRCPENTARRAEESIEGSVSVTKEIPSLQRPGTVPQISSAAKEEMKPEGKSS